MFFSGLFLSGEEIRHAGGSETVLETLRTQFVQLGNRLGRALGILKPFRHHLAPVCLECPPFPLVGRQDGDVQHQVFVGESPVFERISEFLVLTFDIVSPVNVGRGVTEAEVIVPVVVPQLQE